MPFLTLRKLAECLLLELQCQQAERYGSEMRRKELRIRHWPITEIAERMLENWNEFVRLHKMLERTMPVWIRMAEGFDCIP